VVVVFVVVVVLTSLPSFLPLSRLSFSSNKGLMSVFLMGVYDEQSKTFKTVCRVGNGFDDATIQRLQKELKMTKISQDPTLVPRWLEIDKTFVPDFVVQDPKQSPVWEISGAEFTYSPKHTAAAISIRFEVREKGRRQCEESVSFHHLFSFLSL
jgi:DNA ligase-3